MDGLGGRGGGGLEIVLICGTVDIKDLQRPQTFKSHFPYHNHNPPPHPPSMNPKDAAFPLLHACSSKHTCYPCRNEMKQL